MYCFIYIFKLARNLLTIDLDIDFVLSSHDEPEDIALRLAHLAVLGLLTGFFHLLLLSLRLQRTVRTPAKQLLRRHSRPELT